VIITKFTHSDIHNRGKAERIRKYWVHLPPEVRRELLDLGFKPHESISQLMDELHLPKRKNHILRARVSSHEFKKIESEANERQMTLSEYIRFKCSL